MVVVEVAVVVVDVTIVVEGGGGVEGGFDGGSLVISLRV